MHGDNFDLSAYFASHKLHRAYGRRYRSRCQHALMRHQLFRCPSRIWMYRLAKSYPWYLKTLQIKLLHHRGRGGYCFMRLMGYLQWRGRFGITVSLPLSPDVLHHRRPKTHMALIAEVDDRLWFCDLGFGSYGIRAPSYRHDRYRYRTISTLSDLSRDVVTVSATSESGRHGLINTVLICPRWIDFVPPTTSIPTLFKNALALMFSYS